MPYKNRNLKKLWIDNAYNLSEQTQYKVIGNIEPDFLTRAFQKTTFYRPKIPFPPERNRLLPTGFPQPVHTLYDKACVDMRHLGFNPDEYPLYVLYQAGIIEPGCCLREEAWHFDLMRNLRAKRFEAEFAVSMGYSVSSILPTLYIMKLSSENNRPLPARATILNTGLHKILGETALQKHDCISPKPGGIVRYDSLVLHKGQPNLMDTPIYRVFLNLTFAPFL